VGVESLVIATSYNAPLFGAFFKRSFWRQEKGVRKQKKWEERRKENYSHL
jgi:hypothetical protein